MKMIKNRMTSGMAQLSIGQVVILGKKKKKKAYYSMKMYTVGQQVPGDCRMRGIRDYQILKWVT